MLFRMLQGAVLFQYPFNVPAYYALILRSLTVLEGLALYTDPNFKVCKYSSSMMCNSELVSKRAFVSSIR